MDPSLENERLAPTLPRENAASQAVLPDDIDCSTCKECLTAVASVTFRLHVDTHELVTSFCSDTASLLSNDLHELLKMVNALLNWGGGCVCVHCSLPCPVARLDAVVDHRLTSLITNATTYDDNFQRIARDSRHVTYRVKPLHRKCISILDFRSCLSNNQGLGKPSQQQIQSFVDHSFQPSAGSVSTETGPCRPQSTFQLLQCVSLFPSCTVHLHRMGDLDVGPNSQDYGERVANYCWEDLGLGRYISALCKQKTGGCVYLGIEELVTAGTRAWVQVPNCDLGMLFPGCKSKVWVDAREQGVHEPGGVRYLAKDEDVPLTPAQGTGQYVCRGVLLPPPHRHAFQALLFNKIRTGMLWYPNYPVNADPVKVIFHPVTQPGDHQVDDVCVVEVQVFQFHGVAFHDPRGVEAYGVKGVGPAFHIRRLRVDEAMSQIHEFTSSSNVSLAASSRESVA
ncbi:uncharacterized protein LOC143287009 [Babylonia areolata]|uniref:uncharacterized protein LOC143287009 n=1 Tax=Babylonia areolata TaxID=304850 RepID=UPI003FD07896